METIAVAIIGLNGTLIAALVWLLKSSFQRLFGSPGKSGTFDKFSLTVVSLNKDVKENTLAIRELRDYQKDHARSQLQTNETLRKILEHTIPTD